MLAMQRPPDRGSSIGVIDYLEVNRTDGHPWIGLIMVARRPAARGLRERGDELPVCEHVNLNWASPVQARP